MTPDTIGRYQVYAQLGAGGFATVYRAYDPRLDRDVAVKVLHPLLARDPFMRKRFLQEARALASVRHPNLVRLFDAGETDGIVYLAMEYISGRSLDRVALDHPPTVEEILRIVGEIAAALDALHAAGLIHRDVKPANIMVADDGRAVLVDLGIARSLTSDGITSSGMVMGTPGFLAPEQLADHPVTDPRTDVYQLAATAFTLLAGRPPFEGSPAEVLYAIGHRAAPDLHVLCPDLPAGLAAVIAEGLAKAPLRRPPTAGRFAAAVAGAAQQPTLLMPLPRKAGTSSAAVRTTIRHDEVAVAPAPTPVSTPVPAAQSGRPRRSAVRWPRAVVAAGVGLMLLGAGTAAIGHVQNARSDAPPAAAQDGTPPRATPDRGGAAGRPWAGTEASGATNP